MKSMLRFFIYILVLGLAFQTNISAQGFMSKDIVGNITAKSQPVYVYRDGKKLNIGGFEVNLKKGDIIATQKGGKALISLRNGSKIAIASSSRVELTEEMLATKKTTTIRRIIHLIYGKIRAQIHKTRKRYISVKTATAVIGVKGTDFVVEFKEKITLVGTVEGLVNLESIKTKANVDIAPGEMSSVSPSGELMPVSEFAGELLEGFEFFGKEMESDDFSGEKIDL